jgi:hypothetical protein
MRRPGRSAFACSAASVPAIVRRSWRFVLLSSVALGLVHCAAEFAPGDAQPIEVPELISLQHFEPLDNVSYCGSDTGWHYFFHALPFQSVTYKVSRAVLEVEAEHPVTSQAACVLAAGHFDTTPTGTWVYVPSAKKPSASP